MDSEIVLGATVNPASANILQLDDVNKSSFILASTGEVKKNIEIDYSWLPLCSDSYQISPNIEDYVFVQVPIISSNIPNRNLQAFDFTEISAWSVQQGKPVYKTFVGKPTYTNHKNNTIPHLAKGVHFDATMEHVPKYNIWKIHVLLGFDKKKDQGLCEAIVKNQGVTGYSMGAMVEKFVDSVTGKFITLRDPEYNKAKGSIQNGKLRYVSCCGVTYFETSCLGDFGRQDEEAQPPADHQATSDLVWC